MAIQKVLEQQNFVDIAPVDPIKRQDKPRVTVRFGHAFVIFVETSKRTFEIFQRSILDLREFIDAIRDLILRSPTASSKYDTICGSDDQNNDSNRTRRDLQVPDWKLRSPYSPKPRACKVERLREPTLSIRSDAITALFKDKDEPCVNTNLLGANFENGVNCCYIISVLQALRLSPTFRRRIRARSLRSNPIAQEIKKLYNIVEGKGGEKKRQVTSEEINQFRKTMIDCNFEIATENDDPTCQEDPSNVCQFILEAVGLKSFTMLEHNKHNFGIPLNSLHKPPYPQNQFALGTSSHFTDIQQRIVDFETYIEVECQAARSYLLSENKMTPKYEKILEKIEPKLDVPVKQTLKLYSNQIPHILDIFLERKTHDQETGEFGLNNAPIKPNQKLMVPLADQPNVAAYFELVSAVTHVQSDDFSHYIAWGAYHQKGRQSDKMVYAQYDSLEPQPKIYNDSKPADENIDTKARVVLYEFVGLKPMAS